jgi:hypothetical protein
MMKFNWERTLNCKWLQLGEQCGAQLVIFIINIEILCYVLYSIFYPAVGTCLKQKYVWNVEMFFDVI